MPSQKPIPQPCRTQFGKNIVRLRTVAGLTQEQTSERLGVSARYFQSVEAGEYFPSLPRLLRLREILNCRWDDLFDGCKPE